MSIKQKQRYFIVVGIFILVVVILFLLISPTFLFSPMVTVDTNLYATSNNAVFVQTKTDFGSQEALSNFPKNFGTWIGYEYSVETYIKALGADTMLWRGYMSPTFGQTISLTITKSKTDSTFHDPKACINGVVEEEVYERCALTDVTWVGQTNTSTPLYIPLNKLVYTVSKADGTVYQRRMILFFYVKGNQFYSDTVTKVQMELLVPLSGSYEDQLNVGNEFLNQIFPMLFSPAEEKPYHPLLLTLTDWGVGGYVLIIVLFLIPIGIMVYPRIRRRVTK
jgi:hypothetical protein